MIELVAFILLLWDIGLLTYVCVLKSALRESDKDWDHEADQHLAWEGRTEGAHKRRKRVEKILRREQRRNIWLRQEVAGLHHQLLLQEARNQSMAADLAAAILSSEDKAKVREGLVRKIR